MEKWEYEEYKERLNKAREILQDLYDPWYDEKNYGDLQESYEEMQLCIGEADDELQNALNELADFKE